MEKWPAMPGASGCAPGPRHRPARPGWGFGARLTAESASRGAPGPSDRGAGAAVARRWCHRLRLSTRPWSTGCLSTCIIIAAELVDGSALEVGASVTSANASVTDDCIAPSGTAGTSIGEGTAPFEIGIIAKAPAVADAGETLLLGVVLGAGVGRATLADLSTVTVTISGAGMPPTSADVSVTLDVAENIASPGRSGPLSQRSTPTPAPHGPAGWRAARHRPIRVSSGLTGPPGRSP